MKIGILTFTNTANYGASLQAYALQQVIKSKGHECDIIDYRCGSIIKMHDPKEVFKKKGIKKRITAPLMYYVYKKRLDEFRKFEREYCSFSDPCSKKSIAKISKGYDRIIVGSDQVWNTELTNCDMSFFLGFLKGNEKKYSYAASIEKSALSNYINGAVEYIKQFNNISCRESSAAEQLKEMTGRNDITCDVDPTLLIGEKWKKFVTKKKAKDDYIFMYLLPEEKELFDRIRAFAKKNNCKIILLRKGIRRFKGIKTVSVASPIDFINYIAKAKYVISGSFHALCFSLMLGVDYYVTPSLVKERSSRLTDFLNVIETQERFTGYSSYCFTESKIDYKKARGLLQKSVNESLKTIDHILSE